MPDDFFPLLLETRRRRYLADQSTDTASFSRVLVFFGLRPSGLVRVDFRVQGKEGYGRGRAPAGGRPPRRIPRILFALALHQSAMMDFPW